MSNTEWAMWANEQAIVSSYVIMLGGILAVAGAFKLWQIGVYAIVISLLIFVFEYPRGKRRKGKTVERRFQKYLTLMVSRLGPLSRNYYIRFILYLLFCAPCCFILPTLLGAICLIITSIVYLVAAIKGEEWRPVEAVKDSEQEMTETSMAPPSYPPPRTPPISQRQGVQTRSQRAKAATNRV